MADLLRGMAASFLYHQVGELLAPTTRYASYAANQLMPNLFPSPEELIDLYQKSDATNEQLRSWLTAYGVAAPGSAQGSPLLWGHILRRATDYPPFDMLLTLLLRQQYDPDKLEWLLKLHGYKHADARDIVQSHRPWDWTPEQIRVLRKLVNVRDALAGDGQDVTVPAKDYVPWLKSARMHLQSDRNLFELLIRPPDYRECIEAERRDIIDNGTLQQWQALNNYTDDNVASTIRQLQDKIPDATEQLEFVKKGVFLKSVADHFNLDEDWERQPGFKVWMKRLGYNGQPILSQDALSNAVDQGLLNQVDADEFWPKEDDTLRSWAQAIWRAHWAIPGPATAYEMFHRLRPIDPTKPTVAGRPQPRVPVVPGSQSAAHPAGVPIRPVTIEEVEHVQRSHNFGSYFRPQLSGISYSLIRIFDIRRIIEHSLRDPAFQDAAIGLPCIGPDGNPLPARIEKPTQEQRRQYLLEWVRQQYLDRGQTSEGATTSAALAFRLGLWTIAAPDRATKAEWVKRWAKIGERSYVSGRISADNYRLFRNPTFPEPWTTDAELTILEEEQRQALYLAWIKSIRTDFLDAAINADQAKAMLLTAGMQPNIIVNSIQQWSLKMTHPHVMAKTADILKWYNDLLITKAVALIRLGLLGWSNADALLELALPAPKGSPRAGVNGKVKA